MSDDFPRIEPLGEAALLVRFADRLDLRANRAGQAFRAALEADPPAGMEESAAGLGSVLVRGTDPSLVEALERRVRARDWRQVPPPPRHLWRIPCTFGGEAGPELAEAASLAGQDVSGAVEALSTARLRVLALGFAPGMPYLGRLDPAWNLPRRTELTPEVPEGALVVAVRQMVVFGTRAPTGWRRVGMTAFGCFRQNRDRPVALAPGDEVVFPAVSPQELADRAGADALGLGGATREPLA